MTTPAERLRDLGHRLVERLADHLEHAAAGELPVLAPADPARLADLLGDLPVEPPTDPGVCLDELVDRVLEHSNHVHHPGYVGHQVSPPLPEAAVVELMVALLNNGMAIYEMGQLQTVTEERLVAWLCERVGFGAASGGVLCHGGSLGNLTALLAARQAQLGGQVWSAGHGEAPAVLVSSQAHYCIARAAGVMGWGSEGAVPVATGADFRMDPADLPRALERARAAGRRPIAVVASSCTTATGSFDPLPTIADFARDHGLWLHVDGAHGASQVLSERHRAPLAGIERADSIVWDLHKLAGLPALSSAVLFRDVRHSAGAFAQDAAYLFDGDEPTELSHDLGRRTLECTKRAMGLVAWSCLQLVGTRAFVERIDRQVDLAGELHGLVVAAADFEAASVPASNILCFRHRPTSIEPGPELDRHQARLRRAVVDAGAYYLVQAELDGEAWLRVSLMNPATTRGELEGLLGELRRVAG